MTKSIAILIVNTGSPAAPTSDALAPYLEEFLSDRHIVDLPPFLWLPILRHFVIPKRKEASARRYQQIWTQSGSPLLVHTKNTAKKLQTSLGEGYSVFYAMRYGEPSIEKTLQAIAKENPERLFLLPAFAQEARETRGTIEDAFKEIYQKLKLAIPFEVIPSWFDEADYIRALAGSVRSSRIDLKKTRLIASFHGIPVKHASRYTYECEKTRELLEKELGLEKGAIRIAYQSKFGFGNWTTPNIRTVIEEEITRKTENLAILCPGFSADCLESLEEIAIGYRNLFLSGGGKRFTYIPALNESDAAIALYEKLIRRTLSCEKTCHN